MLDVPSTRVVLLVASVRRSWLTLVAGAVFVGVVFAGCSGSSDSLGPWKEEVKLSDGRVIVVERVEIFDVKTPIGDPGSAFVKEARLKVVAPLDLATMPELSMRYRPVIFDYDAANDLWLAIGVNDRACWAFREGHMNSAGTVNLHPNFEFRLLNNSWSAVEIGAERIGLPANLLIKRTTIDEFDIVPLAEKARVDADPGLPIEFLRIEPQVGCR